MKYLVIVKTNCQKMYNLFVQALETGR